jgi:hypothetical protein
MWSDLKFRLRSIIRRRSSETELDNELTFHLELQVEKHMKAGATREEAERLARVDFGAFERTKEACRDVRGANVLENTVRDVAYALRTLRKSPSLVFVAVLAVGFGIGANSAIFTLLNAAALRPLPVHDSGDLVTVYQTIRGLKEP